MFKKAQDNIMLCGKQDIIVQHYGDALECDISNLSDNYDLLFIDAAKAQSQKFFERFLPFVKQNGLIIVDNMLFHGIKKTDPGISRNVRQLVTKIERFTNWIKNNEMFDVTFYDGGDGLAVIKRKC
jgi:predicted O-methyltransferase YrrM